MIKNLKNKRCLILNADTHNNVALKEEHTMYAQEVTLSKDGTTGEIHVRHRAHVQEGKLFYKGKLSS